VEERLAALEAVVAQREAANGRLTAERDKLMEINNRLRHNLSDAVAVANTAAAHHTQQAVESSPAAVSMATAAYPVRPPPPQHPPPQRPATPPRAEAERGAPDVQTTLSGIEAAMTEMMQESRGLRAELTDAQKAAGLLPGSGSHGARGHGPADGDDNSSFESSGGACFRPRLTLRYAPGH